MKKSSKQKKVSKRSQSLKRYWKKIKSISRERHISIPSARNFYSTIESVRSDRLEVVYVTKYTKKMQAYGDKEAFKKFGREIKRGKQKGKIKIVVDKVKEKFLTPAMTSKLREENKIKRISNVLLDRTKTEQHTIPKRFWPKYALKRGHLTVKEALRVAKKVLKAHRSKELSDSIWNELFDES